MSIEYMCVCGIRVYGFGEAFYVWMKILGLEKHFGFAVIILIVKNMFSLLHIYYSLCYMINLPVIVWRTFVHFLYFHDISLTEVSLYS